MSPELSTEGNFERATISKVHSGVNHKRGFPLRLISSEFYIMLRRMPLTEDIISSRYRITGYEQNAVVVNDSHFQQSLVLSANSLHHPWEARSVDDLEEKSLQLIFEFKPEVVLLGTGMRQQFPSAKVMAYFGQKGIGLEVMDNGALCRTFNILVAEDRAVVAAILLNGRVT